MGTCGHPSDGRCSHCRICAARPGWRCFPEFMAFYFPLAHAEIDQELTQVVQDAELGKRSQRPWSLSAYALLPPRGQATG
ncbi:hypothetical protein E4Q08_15370 [Candidatus Accumulibacter phosphatis]|uniref:Transposase n=1 Tax=Candidatus Accumulibacter contiguus TaxID=2954381 RepID=A0ABX1TC48_9PROT|nr:hypothetical protein [Candidatus Accumulibacter contiguus]